MGLAKQDRQGLVKYRLEKAVNTISEIPVLMENKFYRTAANRLYYACFYAASALLINDGFETHTHKGVKVLLGLNYIKENKIEKQFGKTYDQLFSLRQTGDYEDWISIEEEDVNSIFEPAQNFIKEVEKYINNKH